MESASKAEQGTATAPPRSPARSEHVGSLLRPPELLAEIHRVYERGHTTLHAEERAKERRRLRELEDDAIRSHCTSTATTAALSSTPVQSLRAPALRNGTYDGVDELLSDTVGILGELASDAAAAGASCLQFDEPAYSFLVAPGIDEMIAAMGSIADRLMESSVVTDRRFLDALPGDVTTAVHLCRGNYASRHKSSGSLKPVAESLFSLPFDRFLIEWEDVEREGGLSPLRHVPRPGPIVVLGVLSSKLPRIETEDELLRRIEDATTYLPIEQLAISPQCGFASALGARRRRRQRAGRRFPVAQARGPGARRRARLGQQVIDRRRRGR